MEALTSQQLSYEADLLSAWAGEEIMWEPGQPDDPITLGAMAAARFEQDLEQPSRDFAANWGLALGLRRLLACEDPLLLDGSPLYEHQLEVLSALLASESQRIISPEPCPPADPNRSRRCWFEHATGSGKTRSAVALIDAARTGRVLVLTSRSGLVEQFEREITSHGYGSRLRPLDNSFHPRSVCVTTYQMWNRQWDSFDSNWWSLVLCDEVHNSLGPATSGAIKSFEDVAVVGMTATGELLESSVDELFPLQLSSFDLAKATELGVLSPLRVLRVPPAVEMDTLEGVARKGGDYDQAKLSDLLNRDPFNHAVAMLYRDLFSEYSGVIYCAGIVHAEAVASSLLSVGVGAASVSGRTSPATLRKVLDDFLQGKIKVISNAALLAEGWDSPIATVCMHLAPTASRRVYQQRTGRVTRRWPGKDCGIVVDFVSPDYPNSGNVITMHSLLGKSMYLPGDAVTEGPDGPPPEAKVDWHPSIAAPTGSDKASRSAAVRSHWRQLKPELLGSEDLLLWAEAAGAEAASPGMLKDSLRKLQGRPDSTLKCLGAALRSSRGEIRSQACDRLVDLSAEDVRAWFAAGQAALDSDDPAFQRSLSERLVQAAAGGCADQAQGAYAMLLRLAGLEASVFERRARSSFKLPAHLPRQEAEVKALAAMAARQRGAPAAALLASLPHYGPAGQAAVDAAESVFSSPSALAAGLGHRKGRPPGRPFDT
jgi:hypothetical protein